MIAATSWARLVGLAALIGVAGLALSACATDAAAPSAATRSADFSLPSLDPQQQRGRDFAVRRCSGCHTVGLDDGGASDGPAFYRLARRYNPIALERRFAEISAHGVESMPAITFTTAEAADLIAYFDSLQGN
jgi:mono/diheme cytochrome c family protein